jgi:hypothetical protein
MTGDHARRRALRWRAHPAAFNTRGRVSGLAITGAVLALLCTLTVRLASSEVGLVGGERLGTGSAR